ncbi:MULTISPECIES: FAD-dependent oxidoreductase [Nocardia]|uniref:FAD-dependent oxidoreductase n=1 Tax=Nocardia abscessus TaxID=120957 RepID=UPI001894A848|nr:NAD(P)/FAD-dependent oxidoreductase [Nocardia abscessus]MBF6474456.1 FAD-dependent monooxygenase [Nocardia abscessus]
MSSDARILIVGAGVGGLALAQALRRGGVDVTVYEQDPTPTIRNQGYRIHIDSNGNAALRTCLSAAVLDLVRRSSGHNGDLFAAYTHHLDQVMVQTFPEIADDDITCVDRNAFRHALLTGMADDVHFGKRLAGYQLTDSGRVRVEFADGGGDEGDVLVGADGVGSAVRRQLLPDATVRDLGLRCLYGRMTITETTEPLIPQDLHRGFSWVGDGDGCGAGFAPVRFRARPDGTADYLMTTLVATPQRLGVADADLFAFSSEQLWKLAVDTTASWHSAIRELYAHADSGTFFPITIRAAERLDAIPSGPVTLLGDAAHAMPPTGAAGANTALQDAATLAGELLGAARGDKPFSEAVAAYERVMLPRGFAAVDDSLRMAGHLLGNAG